MVATQVEMQSVTRDGRAWQPSYLLEIDAETCIGCGRCYKVCGRSVMDMKGITEDGHFVALDDDDEIERKIMTVVDPGACIGCGACARVCAKGCQTHGPGGANDDDRCDLYIAESIALACRVRCV